MTARRGLPTVENARKTARELLGNTHPRAWAHTQAVASKADSLALKLHLTDIQRQTLVSAAWLARIGEATSTSRRWAPADAALTADEWGLYRISSLLAWHATAPEEAAIAGRRNMLARYPRPDRQLADLLTYADMTVDSTGHDCTLSERVLDARRVCQTSGQQLELDALIRATPRLNEVIARVDKQIKYAPASLTAIA